VISIGCHGSVRYLLSALWLFIGLLIAPLQATATDEGSLVGTTITVGSELDYPPYADVDENGNADGFSVDLIKAAAREVGLKLKFKVGPWAEVKAMLERGEIDALPLVAYSDEREKYFDFSRPHIISHAVAFIRKGTRDIKSLEDLRGKEVIVMRSDSTHEYVIFSRLTDKIILTKTVGESFKLLASGKHDFVIAPKLSGLLLLNELGIDNVEPFGEPLEAYGKGYSFAVHEGNSKLLAELDRGLVLIKSSGEYARIYDKWFGHVDPQYKGQEELIKSILIAVVLLVLLVLLALLWNLVLRRQVTIKTDALKASEVRFEATFAEAAIGLAHIAPDGSWLRVNQALCDIVGYSEDELLQLTFQDITHPDDLESDLNLVKKVLDREIDSYSMEKRYFHKDGSTLWINLTVSLVWKESAEPDYFISAVENITARKLLNQQIIQERNLAQSYLDVAGVMLVALNPAGKITLINTQGLEILGYREGELLNKNWFSTCIPGDMVEAVSSVFDQLMAGDIEVVRFYENPVLTKSGELRTIAFHNTLLTDEGGNITGILFSGEDVTEKKFNEQKLKKLSQAIEQAGEGVVITDQDGTIEYINSSYCRNTGYSEDELLGQNPRMLKSGKQDKAFYKMMWGALAEGHAWQGRIVDKRKDGSLISTLLTVSPIRNNDGEITNYVGVQQDLTDYEGLETQFHQAQKMEAIGTLVGGIAHDFNNALAGITSNLYLARQKITDIDVIGRVKNAEKLAFTAASTIQQLLAFSRKAMVNMETISIASFLKEVIKLHRVSIPENIAFEQLVVDSNLKIKGDINQLQQMLMNLIINARDAVETSKSPKITVSLSRERVTEDYKDPPKAGEIQSGDYACISVIDNGYGISSENLEHIFEPFFTTKEEGKGTGLGLSMSYGTVKTHGGWIYAVPGDGGVGTQMKVYLPLIDNGTEHSEMENAETVLDGKGETILLADDDEMLLNTSKELLEGLNYKVLTARDGKEAVERFMEHRQEIDLLLMDVVMPITGGIEALKRIREVDPKVKVLFTTGYSKLSATAGSNELLSETVLSKPFTISELSQAVRLKLDA